MPFLPPNQQRQNGEGIKYANSVAQIIVHCFHPEYSLWFMKGKTATDRGKL